MALLRLFASLESVCKRFFEFFEHAEGFFDAETNNYVYQHRDHLGNVRLSYTDTNKNDKIDTGEIVEELNYYPFGLPHSGYNEKNNTLAQNYKYQYNGKELQDELGLNINDYGARGYMADLGRWFTVDPLAEKYLDITPYAYVANNPIIFIDPKGEEIDFSWIYRKDSYGNYENQVLVDAFEFFAETETGRLFLSDFAKKGQKIGNYTFNKDGKYHLKGMNLIFAGFDKNYMADALTTSKNNDQGGLDSTIKLSSNGRLVERYLEDIGHEAFIHVNLDAKDFYNDGVINLSSIDTDIKKYVDDYYRKTDQKNGNYPQRVNLKQHFQDDRNQYLLKNFFESMKSYYQKKGIQKSDETIKEELLRGRQISK